MPKRNRVRARARHLTRPALTAERPEAPAPERARPERARARYRGAPPSPGTARAVGVASASLERAAALERGYVVKDFGRLAKVVALMFALLIASGVAVSAILK